MHLYKTSSFNPRDISGSIYYFSVRPTWLLDKEFVDETFNDAEDQNTLHWRLEKSAIPYVYLDVSSLSTGWILVRTFTWNSLSIW